MGSETTCRTCSRVLDCHHLSGCGGRFLLLRQLTNEVSGLVKPSKVRLPLFWSWCVGSARQERDEGSYYLVFVLSHSPPTHPILSSAGNGYDARKGEGAAASGRRCRGSYSTISRRPVSLVFMLRKVAKSATCCWHMVMMPLSVLRPCLDDHLHSHIA